MNRNILKIVLGGLACCSPALLGTLHAAKPATISVFPDEKGQTVGGIGGGIVYYNDWLTNHPNREAVYDTLFNGLGLSCLRMGNWAIEDTPDDWRSVRNDSIVYADAKRYCGKNLPVLMASWSAPAVLKANNSRDGSNKIGKASLKKVNGNFCYDWYAMWWKDCLLRYRSVGVYPDYVSIQNEPDCDDPGYNTMLLGVKESNDVAAYGKALSAVVKKANELPNPPKFLGADNIGIGWNQTQDYINNLDRNLLSGYAFHYYHSGNNDNDRYTHPNDFIESMKGLAKDLNDKPMFMTENSNLNGSNVLDCMYTAWFIANAFNINKVSYYCYWNLIWGDNGNGCINLQKWDSTYAKPWDGGFQVMPDYHGLRHFSKFVRPGMQVINTWASTDQMTTCGFMEPDKSAYTVVVINQGKDEFDIKLDLDLPYDQYESSVTVSVPEWGVYSMHIGEFGATVYMPSHSIVTATYKLRHPKVSPYVFVYDEITDNGNRTNAQNWTPKFVPWPTDTLLIAKGECKMGDYSHAGPITIAPEGTLRLTGDVTANHYINLAGTMKVYTQKKGFYLSGRGIILDGPATFNVGHDTSRFFLNDELRGEYPLTKNGDGLLELVTANHHYSGTWHVEDGTLVAASTLAFGTSAVNIVVDSTGKLAVNVDNKISQLEVNNEYPLELAANLTTTFAYIQGRFIPNGVYTEESHPEYVTGPGRLIVNHPYPIIYKPAAALADQTVKEGSAITGFTYTWNYADSVEVDWNPHQPEGITVDVQKEEQSVDFRGIPVEFGEFEYSVSSVSLEDSVVVQQGLITVLEKDVAGCGNIAAVNSITLSPNKVKKGDAAEIAFYSDSGQQVGVKLFNAQGSSVWVLKSALKAGYNNIGLPANLERGIYIVKLVYGGHTSTLKLVVE